MHKEKGHVCIIWGDLKSEKPIELSEKTVKNEEGPIPNLTKLPNKKLLRKNKLLSKKFFQ